MAATYEPIASTTLGSAASSVTFSGIAADWTDLVLVVNGHGTVNDRVIYLRFNGVSTGSLYSATRLIGYSGGAISDRYSNVDQLMAAGNWSNVASSTLICNIMSYSNTNVFKTVTTSWADNSEAVGRHVGLWRSTSAISSLLVYVDSGSLVAGSTFSLYGIKAA